MACYDALALEFSSRMVSRRTQRRFATALALLFAASAAGTILLCSSMSQMPGMSMPGGWIMSMTWMRMRSQTWLDAGASFLLMWVVMMVAMMLPSLAPMLVQYRQSVASAAGSRLGRLTALVTLAYFFVWTAIGIAVYPLGILLANYEMHYPALSHAAPLATGIVVLLAGAFQLTTWKSRLVVHCHDVPSSGASPAAPRSAWRHGLSLGIHCARCCANLMLILLVIDVMDLRIMAIVTAVITLERLAPSGTRAPGWPMQADFACMGTGALAVVSGLFLIARAARLA